MQSPFQKRQRQFNMLNCFVVNWRYADLLPSSSTLSRHCFVELLFFVDYLCLTKMYCYMLLLLWYVDGVFKNELNFCSINQCRVFKIAIPWRFMFARCIIITRWFYACYKYPGHFNSFILLYSTEILLIIVNVVCYILCHRFANNIMSLPTQWLHSFMFPYLVRLKECSQHSISLSQSYNTTWVM